MIWEVILTSCIMTLCIIYHKGISMKAVTVNEAKANLDRLIEQVFSDVEPTIICTVSNPVNAEHLRQSIAAAEAGKKVERDLQ